MISYISSWAEQVIISVIIGVILEMILPKGNSKKYIKTVIGVYILYTILSPVISFGAGGKLKIDYSKYQDYFNETEEYKNLEDKFNNVTTNSIENTYKKEIEKKMKEDIKELGFFVENISFDIDLKTGEINKVKLSIEKKENSKSNNTSITVNKIEIGNLTNRHEKNNLSRQEIEKIKEKLKNDYGIEYEQITINSI